jgi:tetratricopeptide (TPR) repeat protein
MKRLNYLISGFFVLIMLNMSIVVFASDMTMLLGNGKLMIENGEYEKAVDCLGKILEGYGDKTNDPQVVAFGSAVQAYGIWKMNNPQMKQMIIQYLNTAIELDPTWEYPKKMLEKVIANSQTMSGMI